MPSNHIYLILGPKL